MHYVGSSVSLRSRRLLHSANSASAAPSRCSFQPDLLFPESEYRDEMFCMSDLDLLARSIGENNVLRFVLLDYLGIHSYLVQRLCYGSWSSACFYGGSVSDHRIMTSSAYTLPNWFIVVKQNELMDDTGNWRLTAIKIATGCSQKGVVNVFSWI